MGIMVLTCFEESGHDVIEGVHLGLHHPGAEGFEQPQEGRLHAHNGLGVAREDELQALLYQLKRCKNLTLFVPFLVSG